MAAVRTSQTEPERAVLRALRSNGYRPAKSSYGLPGRPDVVLPSLRVVVFIHGCFWHGHSCKRGKLPKTNAEFWSRKIAGNKKRDARASRAVRALGWRCFSVWQCSLERDTKRLLNRLKALRAEEPRH